MSGHEGPGPITSLLAADHRRLDELLRSAAASADQIDQSIHDQFRVGLLGQIVREEERLMPEVEGWRGSEPLSLAAKLRLDHGALATLLMPAPTAQILATIRRILSDHNQLEEGPDGLYALCDRLPDAETEPLLVALRAAPQLSVMRHSDSPAVMKTLAGALARAGYGLETVASPEKDERG